MQITTKSNAWGYMIPNYLSDSSISNKSSFFFLSESYSRKNKDNKNKSLKKLPILIKDIQINDIYNNTNYIKKNVRLKKNFMSFPSLHIVNMNVDINKKKNKTSYFQFECMNKLFRSRISKNKIENKNILLSGKKINYNNTTTLKPKIKLTKPKYISRKMDLKTITNL